LKDIKIRKSSKIELEYWTEKLIQDGIKISKIRNKKLLQISEETLKIFPGLAKNDEKLSIKFLPSFPDINDINEEKLLNVFNDNYSKEISYGTTFLGPHKDDFEIKINNKISSDFSSRGQIRTATLSLKLGEANSLKKSLSDTPVIVLDDILSELDFERRKTVVNFIKEYDQIFLTSPDEALLKSIVTSDDKIFEINAGKLVE
jgi:DNA replication and repair protein RecF